MRNVTVRSSLMGALALFASMIVFGAAVGVFALGRADESTVMVHDISARVIGINDAYKDTARTRSALNMAYIALKEENDEARKTVMLDKCLTRLLTINLSLSGMPRLYNKDCRTNLESNKRVAHA